MPNFKADFSYLDDNNILRRNKKYHFESDNIVNAVIVLKDEFTIIKIRSLNETNNLTVENYSLKNNNIKSFEPHQQNKHYAKIL